jgi:hypothetical protein
MMKRMILLAVCFATAAAAQPAISETLKTTSDEAHPAVHNASQTLPVTRKLDMGALNPQPIPPGRSSLGSGPIGTRSKASTTKPTPAPPTPAPRWDVSKNKPS